MLPFHTVVDQNWAAKAYLKTDSSEYVNGSVLGHKNDQWYSSLKCQVYSKNLVPEMSSHYEIFTVQRQLGLTRVPRLTIKSMETGAGIQ